MNNKFKIVALIVSSIALFGCTDEPSVKRYAEMDGWDSYEITGYRWRGCGEEDFYHTGFKAIKNGRSFSGTVCKGLFFRGSTLRLD